MSLDSARHHITDKRDHPVVNEMLQKQVEVIEADYQKRLYDDSIAGVRKIFSLTNQNSTLPFFEETLRLFSLHELVIFLRQFNASSNKNYFLQSVRRNLEKKPSRINVPKSEGGLSALSIGNSILLRNILYREDDYIAWVQASHCVPCTPLLRSRTKAGNRTKKYYVMTRYVGLQHEDIENLLCRASSAMKMSFENLMHDIYMQRIRTLATLLQKGIVQSHPHTSNFTVEFVRKDVLETHAEKIGEPLYEGTLLNPAVVNTIPYKKEGFAFSPSVYFGNPDAYVPVSRIIDFDDSHINGTFDTLSESEKMEWYETTIEYYVDKKYLDPIDAEELLAILRGENPWQTT